MSTIGIWKLLMAMAVAAQLAVIESGIGMISARSWMLGGVTVVVLGWVGVIATCAAMAYVDRWPEQIAVGSLMIPAVASFGAAGRLLGLVDLGFAPLAIVVVVLSALWVVVVRDSTTWPRSPGAVLRLDPPR